VLGAIDFVVDKAEKKVLPRFTMHVDVILEIVNVVDGDECTCAGDLGDRESNFIFLEVDTLKIDQ
jgi:hypothetical protein